MSEPIQEGPTEYLPPSVEEVIHNAGMEVRKIPLGPSPTDGFITLLRFHTGPKVYTIKLDDGGVKVLQEALGGVPGTHQGILVARPGDVPGLR